MLLTRLSYTNLAYDTIIGGHITEYDIRDAGASAMRELQGEEVYARLMRLSKYDRKVEIGMMQVRDKPLAKKLNNMMLKYLNAFISANNIKDKNIIATTRDSVVVYNKVPKILKFGAAEFINKDGIFSSMYRIGRTTFYYDSLSGNIICKGIADEVIENSVFVNTYLKKYFSMIEGNEKSGEVNIHRILAGMRSAYINSEDTRIFKDVLKDNMYGIVLNDELVYMDIEELEEDMYLVKESNYLNIVLPIMRSALYNG